MSRLYDALETGKLGLDDLAPRIKELRTRQDELSRARLEVEVEKTAQGIKHVDAEVIKSYAKDLKSLLEEADIAESKAFLRSFIKRIAIDKSQAVIHYTIPVPYGEEIQTVGVLPMVTPEWGRGDSNPHARGHMILSHARLPVPTLPQIQNSLNKAANLVNSSQTAAWVDNFIRSRPSGTSPNTISFYQMTLKKLIGYPLTPEGITSHLSNLPCGNGKRNYYIAVRAFCNWLHRSGYIPTNPISLVPPPKTKKKLLASPTAEDVDTIIGTATSLRETCLVALAFSSGLRLSELAWIDVTDIDWETMTIHVVLKGNRESKAVFDDRTKQLLREYIGHKTSGSLFGLKPRGIQQTMARLSQESGIKFSCHSFRRAFASSLRRKGLYISHIMTLGNWQDLSMPLRYSQSVGFEDSMRLYRELA